MKIQIIAIFLIAVLAVFFVAGCTTTAGNATISEKKTVKIGIILPLTGGLANLGESARDSALLAQDDLPSNSKYNYLLIFEDDSTDPKTTSTAATKLINVDKVDALVSFTSGPGNVVSPIAQQNKILHVGIASDANIAKGEYNFLHWTMPEEENKVLISELQKRGLKKVAVIALNQQGTEATMSDFKKQINSTEIKIVYYANINFGDTDFKTILLKAEEAKPDIYLLEEFPPEIDIIAKQMKELGIETPVTAIETIEASEHPELFEGVWYIQAAEANNEFQIKFSDKYPGKTPTLASGNVYDAVRLIVNAYETAGKSSAEKPTAGQAAKELSKIKNFSGALGILNVGDEGIIESQASVRMIKDGKPVTIG